MRYAVSHRTTYRYGDPVTLAHNQAHLTPRDFARQRCLGHQLLITPPPAILRTWTDYFGNQATFFALEEEHRELSVTAASEVEILAAPLPDPANTPAWENVREALARPDDEQHVAAAQFTFDSPSLLRHERLAGYATESFPPGRPILAAALDLTGRIFRDFKYDPKATCVSTPTLEVLDKRRGVCQDFAHLQIACLRSLGLAARYVSGFLLTDPRPGQPKLVGADASHAWLSVFCGALGWVDLDPTNDLIPATRHVTVAWGRDYGDVCPIQGVFVGGGHHTMEVAVDVAPLESGQ